MKETREEHIVVAVDAGLRLDRWFREHFPGLPHSALARLLRRGAIRLDSRRVTPGQRLQVGQHIHISSHVVPGRPARRSSSDVALGDELSRRILYQDRGCLVLDKPYGLAVQGGTGIRRHIDGALSALGGGIPADGSMQDGDADERLRLVHRLDRDTTGALLVARTRAAARRLGEWMGGGKSAKLYWALVEGRPSRKSGEIALALIRCRRADGREWMAVASRPAEPGFSSVDTVSAGSGPGRILPARTLYRVLASKRDPVSGCWRSWLALTPMTGRTHQLRVHCAALGMPIVGDGKYGRLYPDNEGAGNEGKKSKWKMMKAQEKTQEKAQEKAQEKEKLHLHARALRFPCSGEGWPGEGRDTRRGAEDGLVCVRAPLPEHMVRSWQALALQVDRIAGADRFLLPLQAAPGRPPRAAPRAAGAVDG